MPRTKLLRQLVRMNTMHTATFSLRLTGNSFNRASSAWLADFERISRCTRAARDRTRREASEAAEAASRLPHARVAPHSYKLSPRPLHLRRQNATVAFNFGGRRRPPLRYAPAHPEKPSATHMHCTVLRGTAGRVSESD